LPQGERSDAGDEAGIRINVDRSTDTRIQVLADPRFLAPLLLLLDFIFAWIVLELFADFLSMLELGIFRRFALIIFAAILLLPIAREVIRTRAVLRPPRSLEEMRLATKQARVAVYAGYVIATAVAIGVGLFLLIAVSDNIAQVFAWVLLGFGAVLLASGFFLKRRIDRYFESLVKPTV
jgi:hypothetical protein